MSVIIGSARSDERGKLTGGKAGDQTGKEVSTQAFYMHSKGWNGFRAKNQAIANKLAEGMKKACDNNNVGYDQNERLGVLNNGVDSKVKTEGDCGTTVRACMKYAGINVGNFNTANAEKVIMATGLFDKVTIKSEKDCKKGDILCTKTKGHIVIVVEAPENTSNLYPVPTRTLQKGSKGEDVKWLQYELNKRGFNCGAIDGIFGNGTKTQVINLQRYFGLSQDGVVGPKTLNKLTH